VIDSKNATNTWLLRPRFLRACIGTGEPVQVTGESGMGEPEWVSPAIGESLTLGE
jgi:hypothetical protein